MVELEEEDNIETCENCGKDFPVTEDTWVKWTGGGRWGLDPPEPAYICPACEAKIETAWARREEREDYEDAEDF